MPKGYWLACVDVTDPEGYKAYVAAIAGPLEKFGASFLVRAGRSERPEGQLRSRIVVIQFPSHDAALECYRSPEYAKVLALRQGRALIDLAIVEGYDGPRPAGS
jgi:uncharacterized protein (DUF1330 family)